MSSEKPTLHLMCGKIASGKSTLTARLAQNPGTVVIAEDHWLDALYAGEMHSVADYVTRMTRLRRVIGPHIASLLNAGLSVVLDFQANTVEARAWMRGILEATTADHRLHYLDVPDEVCLERLRARNASGEHPFAPTEEEFHRVTRHFVPPAPEEGFEILRHSID